jgi:hypothetical protein
MCNGKSVDNIGRRAWDSDCVCRLSADRFSIEFSVRYQEHVWTDISTVLDSVDLRIVL